MKNVRAHWLLWGSVIAALALCVCLLGLFLAGLGIAGISDLDLKGVLITPSSTPELLSQTSGADSSRSGLQEILPFAEGAYNVLKQTTVPVNDWHELALRLKGGSEVPPLLEVHPPRLQIGAQKKFWVSNADTNQYFQVTATLQFITDHAYFWIEEGIRFDQKELTQLAVKFENQIYPTNRRFFGSEWTPGVDGDPHLYILYAQNLGVAMAGYFSSSDELPLFVHPYSNGHEMFILNADSLDLGEEETLGVLAHEFQHMIHWNADRNETTWINEGLSELAIFLHGMMPGSDASFIRDTDIQLNDWPDDLGAKRAHYGAAFLFMTYFYDRFGPDSLRALVAEEHDDLSGIEHVLEIISSDSPSDEGKLTLEDFFLDWAITLYLQDGGVGDGRYAYKSYEIAPKADATETIDTCPLSGGNREVSQFGIDYIRITCPGEHRLIFEGSMLTKVLPVDPFSGHYAFWSNRGDESDMTLTRKFDFSGQSGPLTLSYRTWFDLERDFDYAYVTASEDGEVWQILKTPSGTLNNPTGNSFGWGYNGMSNGWIEEQVDLSAYAGKKVWIRFEYVTDAAVTGEGMLLDDIKIQEVGYSTDFESDDGGWQADGWVRIRNVLPQEFVLALLTFEDQVRVDYIQLAPDNTAEIPISLRSRGDEVVLVVSGVARYTRQRTAYRIEIKP